METKSADKRTSRRNAGAVDSKMVLVIVAIFFMAAILVVLAILVLTMRENQRLAEFQPSTQVMDRIEFATEGVTAADEDSLQKAVDDMMNADEKAVGLFYQNDAFSNDGENVTCYIGNSDMNDLPAFFTIATDGGMSDVIYTSGLLKPGQVMEKITLDHPLESGNHTIFVALTLIDEVDGEQVIDGQAVFTMDLHVS